MDEKTKKKIEEKTPFNLSLLNLDQNQMYKLLGQVTSGNMFDGANYNLHPEGLWSNELFGPMGSPDRMNKQAYIDMFVETLHPLVYREMISSSAVLDDIMAGKVYAVFDKEKKMFVQSNAIDGRTGYAFFWECLKDLELEDTGSPKRQETIKLMKKNKDIMNLSKFIVLQAGYRDVEFKDGQINHDEVNQIYRELLSLSNSLGSSVHRNDIALVDNIRYAIQKCTLKLFMYLGEITGHGKKKLIQGKWALRNVFQTTRNVITAPRPSGRFANDPRNSGYFNIKVGIFQHLVTNMPYTVRGIKNSFLAEKFGNPLEPVSLVNKKSLKEELVNVRNEWFDLFQSEEGIKKLVQRFRPKDVRHRVMEVDGKYLALIYKGPDGTFKIMKSIDELPPGRSKDHVSPLTFIELLYICTNEYIDNAPGFCTRYPIEGVGSNVPGFTKMITTTKSEIRRELNDNWEIDETKKPFYQFPINNVAVFDSMSPPTVAYKGQGADNDGDMENLITAFTREAREELINYKKSREAYIGPDGSIRYQLSYDTVNFVCANLSVFEDKSILK